MSKSRIEWTERVWNPVTGCTKVSAGCKNCYAERMAVRSFPRLYGQVAAEEWQRNGLTRPRRFTDVWIHPDRLEMPLHWRKPSLVFVNSMSDLFHDDVPEEFIGRVWCKMLEAHRHTFQLLTKRAERMNDIVTRLVRECERKGLREPENIWIGVSVENQEQAEIRIPLLLQTRAAVRWVSVEPMLGAVDLNCDNWLTPTCCRYGKGHAENGSDACDGPGCNGTAINWVVAGGESGPHHRPMNIKWLESIVDQCQTASVPVFVKQDSGQFPGQQGRIPDRLWIKQYPKAIQ